MNTDALTATITTWRTEAEVMRRRGADRLASCLESCAQDLETALQGWQMEALTIEEAVEESGFSYGSLQQRLAKGQLVNSGTRGSPRILRSHLPIKGARGPRLRDGEPDLAAELLDAAS